MDNRYGWRDERRAKRESSSSPTWRGPVVATLWVLLVALAAAALGAM